MILSIKPTLSKVITKDIIDDIKSAMKNAKINTAYFLLINLNTVELN